MKRMTLLVSLIMVFSLFAVTAAVAGPGPGAGEGDRIGEMVMTQTHERGEVHSGDAPCAAGDEAPECEPVRERTQTRERVQEREYDGGCVESGAECDPVGDPIQARDRDRDQIRTNDGACTDCEPEREMTRTEAYERLMDRVAAYVGDSGEGEYLFAIVRWMWTHMYGPVSALFL